MTLLSRIRNTCSVTGDVEFNILVSHSTLLLTSSMSDIHMTTKLELSITDFSSRSKHKTSVLVIQVDISFSPG